VARAQPVLEAAGVARRCAVVGGSFFETIPEGGDAYLLKYILHDWDDAASLAILAACRRVFRPEGRLLIMERIVGGPNDGLETKTSDLNMLVSPDGQERTADEFAALWDFYATPLRGGTRTLRILVSMRVKVEGRDEVVDLSAYELDVLVAVAPETGNRGASQPNRSGAEVSPLLTVDSVGCIGTVRVLFMG
jgi:O-methyltransferase domain